MEARSFCETQPDVSTLVSLGYRRRLVRVDSCRGWSNLLRLPVRQGGFDAHMTLQNKDLPARIRYSTIPKSSDRSHGSLVGLEKGKIFNFSSVYVCLIANRNLTNATHHVSPVLIDSLT